MPALAPLVLPAALIPGLQVGVTAGGEAGTATTAATLGVDATAVAIGDHDDVDQAFHLRGVAATGGAASLRAGGPAWLAVHHWAHASYDALPAGSGDGVGLFTGALEHQLDLGAVPSLFASRDAVRAGFAREQVGVTARGLSYLWAGGHRVDVIDEGLAFAWTWQPDGRQMLEAGLHAEMLRYSRARDDGAPTFTADVLRFTAQLGGEADTTAGGGVIAVAPLALTGVRAGGGVYVDLAGGVETGGGGAVTVGTGSYEVALHAPLRDDAQLDARAHRHLYATLDGQLSLEDRVDAGVTVPATRTTFALRGFAAHTRWWPAADAPSIAAVTGGGELAIARTDRGLDWNASLAVARSFYATADGDASAPQLGARGTLEVRRALHRHH